MGTPLIAVRASRNVLFPLFVIVMSLLQIHVTIPSKNNKSILSKLIRSDVLSPHSLRSFFEAELLSRVESPVGELQKVKAIVIGSPQPLEVDNINDGVAALLGLNISGLNFLVDQPAGSCKVAARHRRQRCLAATPGVQRRLMVSSSGCAALRAAERLRGAVWTA